MSTSARQSTGPRSDTPEVASVKAASLRVAERVALTGGIKLPASVCLEAVAAVLGVKNWQTLLAMAKAGKGPRVPTASSPAVTHDLGTAQELERDTHVLFERHFAIDVPAVDQRNFRRSGDDYVEERIQALYEGFLAGLSQQYRTVRSGPTGSGKTTLSATEN